MALSGNKPTIQLDTTIEGLPVKASTTIYAGALVCNDATGMAVPGSISATLIARGVADAKADNSAGADGAIHAKVRPGIFKFKNHGADLVVAADTGKDCYIIDDETVAKTSDTGARSRAGKVVEVKSDGVFVAVGLAY
jgi:hypothetical protein